jgi:hypothetical protein
MSIISGQIKWLQTSHSCTVVLSWYYGHMIYVQLVCPDITDIWFMNICSVPILQASHSCTVVLSWYYGHMIYVQLFCLDITDIWFMYSCSVLILPTYDLCTFDLSWYYGHMIYVQLFCPDITVHKSYVRNIRTAQLYMNRMFVISGLNNCTWIICP